MARIVFHLRDVRGDLIHDPRILLRCVHNDSGHALAFQVAGAGTPIAVQAALAPGGLYRVEISPSTFSPALRVLHLVDDEKTFDLTLLHRASAWWPAFTAWSALAPPFESLKTVLQDSRRCRVGRATEPVHFIGPEYDAVDPTDESRVYAKASLLNLYALLAAEPRPGTAGGHWWDGLGEIFLATRERILGTITERDAALIERIVKGAHRNRYAKAPASLHAGNFSEIPGFVFDRKKLFSVKTRDAYGNLQLTVARGELDGLPAVLLDADCDENGRAFAHLLDLPKHAVTGGTHPVEIHDILVRRDPQRDLGYGLEPIRSREEVLAGRIEIRIREVREVAADALDGIRHIGVIGDSVTWGQGLLEAQKMHDIVRRGLPGPATVQVTSLAHSGAVIGVGLDPQFGAAPAHPEVPRARPSILEQVPAFPAPDSVDLLLMNGGINDLDVRYILNPRTSVQELTADTHRVCDREMGELLEAVCRRFSGPRTRIVVIGYYPVLSHLSDPLNRRPFLEQLAVAMPAASEGAWIQLAFWDRIIENCAVFHTESSRALESAVTRANATFGGGRLLFAAPPFRPENAALAPQAWLFGLNALFGPQDPLRDERRIACDRDEPDIFRRLQCHRASAGHPNPLGAVEFAAAIVRAVVSAPAIGV
jgi:hypothetical protein